MTATRTEQIRVRVSPQELAAIRERAEHDGRTVSGYLRRLGVTAPVSAERIAPPRAAPGWTPERA